MKDYDEAEMEAKMEENKKFWESVPDAGIDEESGAPAEYLVDSKRTPKGETVNGRYSLGDHIEIDGRSMTRTVERDAFIKGIRLKTRKQERRVLTKEELVRNAKPKSDEGEMEENKKFWESVPDAGIDEETGEPAEYLVDDRRTPKGQFVGSRSGGRYSLGDHIEVDGQSMTRTANYDSADSVFLSDVVDSVFTGAELKNKTCVKIDKERIHAMEYKLYPHKNFIFTVDKIGVREYKPKGRGDKVYLFDRSSDKKLSVKGQKFQWVASGFDLINRYKNIETGEDLFLCLGSEAEVLQNSIITADEVKNVE